MQPVLHTTVTVEQMCCKQRLFRGGILNYNFTTALAFPARTADAAVSCPAENFPGSGLLKFLKNDIVVSSAIPSGQLVGRCVFD